jgi:CubicO group peptidase (beta-lactamase class C family)
MTPKMKQSISINALMILLVLTGLAITGYNCSSPQQQKATSETKTETKTQAVTEPHIKKADGTPVLLSHLDKAIPELLEQAEIPGMSIAVFNDSKVLYSRVFGVKHMETKEPVTENTMFEAASLTKPLLAYIAMKLVDEGKLDPDKPLYQYWKYKDIMHDERYKLITARIVLKHASGFPNWRPRRKSKKLDINFTPGEKYSYSGEGYVYLQKVIEKILGKDLETIAKEKVFIPLNMEHSTLVLRDVKLSSTGHTADMKPVKKRPGKQANGAASLHTTANDYARFLLAVANGEGLSEAAFQDMLKSHITVPEGDKKITWGLGWGLDKAADDTWFWHWGDNGVFKAYTMASIDKKTGLIYFANSYNGLSIVQKITDMTMGGKYSVFSVVRYPQYDGPVPVLRKMIINEGLEAGIKKYNEWKTKEPAKFEERTLNSIGYYLMGKKKMKEAIEIFKLNVDAYPEAFNVYDSLGEAYMKNGDKELAIKNYEKSVQINPENQSGIDALKKLKGLK